MLGWSAVSLFCKICLGGLIEDEILKKFDPEVSIWNLWGGRWQLHQFTAVVLTSTHPGASIEIAAGAWGAIPIELGPDQDGSKIHPLGQK